MCVSLLHHGRRPVRTSVFHALVVGYVSTGVIVCSWSGTLELRLRVGQGVGEGCGGEYGG